MKVHLVNPSDVAFGIGVITPRWLYVLAGATPAKYGDPIIVDETLKAIDLERVQVFPLFANSLSIIREKAAARGIDLVMDAPKDLGSIRSDARKVKQIVYNLLSNAVKFSNERGEVTLQASRVPRADVGRLSDSILKPWLMLG